MAREVTCPVCDANIPLDSRDGEGDYVYCSFCNAQLRLEKIYKDEDSTKLKGVEDYD